MTLADDALLWYDANKRDLPWRQPGTSAWAVLVSEVMLQQTPVIRVEPAWRSWMTRWPTPADLAEDPPAEAIRMWGRLGYPRRAMRLHACAVALVEQHDGAVPSDLDQLLALPGVGSYTARAVATFAYGQRHPVVDTNVRRVVARAVEGKPDAGPSTTAADLTAMAELLPEDAATAARASIALMELGAIVCTARSPRCAACCWKSSGMPPARSPASASTSCGATRCNAPAHWPAWSTTDWSNRTGPRTSSWPATPRPTPANSSSRRPA
jgi:A/G-specific adenine glycosylase